MNAAAQGFSSWVGGLAQGHIATRVFSEECFPCLSPTTVLTVVPDASSRPNILFTLRKRRKNKEIEAHSLHTSSLQDGEGYLRFFLLFCAAEFLLMLVFPFHYLVSIVQQAVVTIIVLDTSETPRLQIMSIIFIISPALLARLALSINAGAFQS